MVRRELKKANRETEYLRNSYYSSRIQQYQYHKIIVLFKIIIELQCNKQHDDRSKRSFTVEPVHIVGSHTALEDDLPAVCHRRLLQLSRRIALALREAAGRGMEDRDGPHDQHAQDHHQRARAPP